MQYSMKMLSNFALVLFIMSIASVSAHSWINNPPGRFSSDPNYCLTKDDGTLFRDAKGSTICGQDAQGIDLFVMRPNTMFSNPCYYSGDGTFGHAPAGVIEEDGTLCVQWAANAHDTDPDRNDFGGVRFSLTDKLTNPTQADFDKNILATVPYEKFPGAKIKIPGSYKPGQYVLEFFWWWPVPATANNPYKERLFTSCANLTILAHGDPALQTKQSTDYGMGLPSGFKNSVNWFCNAADPVYSNSTNLTPFFTADPTAANPNPSMTSAPATSAPSTTAAPTTAAPATSAPASTAAPATAAPATSAPATAAPVIAAPVIAAPAASAPVATAAPGSSPAFVPGPSSSNTRTVSNGSDLAQALSDGVQTIVLNDGQYNAPSNGYGFKIVNNNVKILAVNAGKASIVCQTSGSYGLNVQGTGAYVYGVIISNCASAVYTTSSQATFDTITATNNFNNAGLGSGFHAIVGSVSTIKNSVINGNRGYAGIYCYGTVNIQNSQVTNNQGGGITARYSARVNVVSTTIDSNTGSGIYASESSTVVVDQSTITSNSGAYYGGGIGIVNSVLNVTNSLVRGNSAAKQAGGIYIESSVNTNVYIASSQIVLNTAPGTNNGIYFPVKAGVNVVVSNTVVANTGSSTPSSTDEVFCCSGVSKTTINAETCSYPSC